MQRRDFIRLVSLISTSATANTFWGCKGSGFSKKAPPIPVSGPSVVTTQGTQLFVQRRNSDGSLQPAASYAIRGVNWSPASRGTNTTPSDPNNANARRTEFFNWYQRDIPLLKQMNINTVRVYLDLGIDNFDTQVKSILDMLNANGIMVILTADGAVNDLNRINQVVPLYKNHPALLMWILGSEWNLNRYFGVASSVLDAAQRTQAAAMLTKSLDTNHPVSTSYGEIDINQSGLQLADTQNYVNNICTAVDAWGLNIYRGITFGNLFSQWQFITSKPMFLGEFGADAFQSSELSSCPSGSTSETAQANWNLSLWKQIFSNLSAANSANNTLGGCVFEWNDEWWKVPPPGSQQTCGVPSNGQPDGFSNEEYFGLVDIDRNLRQAYMTMQAAFDPSFHL
jgi:hypothetical protein